MDVRDLWHVLRSGATAPRDGLLSLPYDDGPELEWQSIGQHRVRHLWLLPISAAERELKKRDGVEVLERLFESPGIRASDPMRPSVV
jgi:hypothetical protein